MVSKEEKKRILNKIFGMYECIRCGKELEERRNFYTFGVSRMIGRNVICGTCFCYCQESCSVFDRMRLSYEQLCVTRGKCLCLKK